MAVHFEGQLNNSEGTLSNKSKGRAIGWVQFPVPTALLGGLSEMKLGPHANLQGTPSAGICQDPCQGPGLLLQWA